MARSPDAGEHADVNVTDDHQSANECNDSLEGRSLFAPTEHHGNHETRIDRARGARILIDSNFSLF